MASLFNRAGMTVSGTPGTGTITLNAAIATPKKYLSFAGAGVTDATVVPYLIEDGVEFEFGIGTYTSSGTTLSRDTVRASSNSGAKISATSAALVYIDAGTEDIAVPAHLMGHIDGLILSNSLTDATNDIGVSPGVCVSDDGIDFMEVASTITKRLDAAWAVGSGNGGLDAGSIANDWYHMWLIKRPDTGVVDMLFSASATSPTMPSNYTRKRRIGAVLRISNALGAFHQYGDEFRFDSVFVDVDDANPGTAAVTRTLTVPDGIKVKALVSHAGYSGASHASWLSSLDSTNQTVQGQGTASLTLPISLASPDSTATWSAGECAVWTDTFSRIRSRISGGNSGDRIGIITLGWVDPRGRNW